MNDVMHSVDDILLENKRDVVVPVRRTKRIAPQDRRRRINFMTEPVWVKRLLWRLKEDSQFLRSTVQLGFALLCLWIGIEFSLFMKWGMSNGTTAHFNRPPGVEGFLPISALMSLKYWIETSVVNSIHPSALFILLAIVAVSLLLKKSFCSWLCPIGTLSESLWMLGERLFGKNLQLPKWLDYPLRSLKYGILAFFVWAILGMDISSLAAFISSPYNKMADAKMFLFFVNISITALGIIFTLMVLSVVVKNFWCRFLCPYGALLGVVSLLSPFKITREKSTCVDCNLCTDACPSNILVHKAGRVWSDECTSCLRCVEVCPVKDTLLFRTSISKQAVPSWVFGVLVTGVFVAITGLAMLTNHWKNDISQTEYLQHFQNIESPLYEH